MLCRSGPSSTRAWRILGGCGHWESPKWKPVVACCTRRHPLNLLLSLPPKDLALKQAPPFPSHLDAHPTGLSLTSCILTLICARRTPPRFDPSSNHLSVSPCPLPPLVSSQLPIRRSTTPPLPPSDGDTKSRLAIAIMHRTYSMRATRAPTASQIQVILLRSSMDSTSGGRRVVDKTTRTPLHRRPQLSPVVSLEKGPSVSSPLPPSLLP